MPDPCRTSPTNRAASRPLHKILCDELAGLWRCSDSAGCTYGGLSATPEARDLPLAEARARCAARNCPELLRQVTSVPLAAPPGRLACRVRATSVHLLSQIASRLDGADDELAIPVLSHRLRQCAAGRGSAH